jgi:hypothetical protein
MISTKLRPSTCSSYTHIFTSGSISPFEACAFRAIFLAITLPKFPLPTTATFMLELFLTLFPQFMRPVARSGLPLRILVNGALLIKQRNLLLADNIVPINEYRCDRSEMLLDGRARGIHFVRNFPGTGDQQTRYGWSAYFHTFLTNPALICDTAGFSETVGVNATPTDCICTTTLNTVNLSVR